MLADMKLWPDFNKAYVTYFPEGKRPARSAFGTSGLALGGPASNLNARRTQGRNSGAGAAPSRAVNFKKVGI